MERYVEDGSLRIEWRDFPYQGQESVNAALAARAAQSQGAFWEYNALLFENQSSSNSGGFSDENLVRLAEEAGLDTRQFERDLRSEASQAAVAADFEEGQSSGISGTPTFIINGQVLVGLQEAGVFAEVIEEAAREANGGSADGGEADGG